MLQPFLHQLLHALKNLLPIVLVVLFFQLIIFQSVPSNPISIAIGLFVVAIGIALFLLGLELSIFPVGKNLANQFARRGSLPLLMFFGFAIGFAAVIAEPALIAVAEQAQLISDGRVDGLTLRLIVATSVGLVMALGVVRIILGWPIHWLMIGGYITVLLVTFFAPEEIVGLAYDSGGVTTNIVTVPLIAALGLGLASSIKGRNPLTDGFGLVALAVMVPMISVQLYGIWVYQFSTAATLVISEAGPSTIHWLLKAIIDLATMVKDILPMILVVLVFQYLILRRPLANPLKVTLGFVMVLFGLYAFVLGLKLGLFPVGALMAEQLINRGMNSLILLFAFMIGFATTMAEPALIAIGNQAEEAAKGKLKGSVIRLIVALGVAIGITVGVYRIISGDSIHYYIMAGYALVVILTAFAPKYIIALAFDLGGVTTSEVTVPLVTALGIGLASAIEGRNVLIDGFGLIAFASIFPIITVMLYAIAVEHFSQLRSAAA
ncbi:membrane protein [Alishewanella longhuensis]|uniref:Membrane protein n=2 Tax=Alishewanella longhuensis TaxID=1091037 RepID=A0ABQ3KZD2_9ALTE|nr:membrane protein [Alishewanella longhuensis]